MNPQNFVDVFYSNFNANIDYQAIDEIFDLTKNHLVNYKKNKINSLENYHITIEQIKNGAINTFDLAGGQIGHLALKVIAKEHLKSKNYDVYFERWFQGRIVDIITKDSSIIVECGDTDPNKILEYFEDLSIKEIILLSYPKENDKWVFGHIFSRGAGLEKYLNNKKDAQFSKIKSIIQRR